VFVK